MRRDYVAEFERSEQRKAHIIAALQQAGGEMSVFELAEITGEPRQSIGILAGYLQRDGIVARQFRYINHSKLYFLRLLKVPDPPRPKRNQKPDFVTPQDMEWMDYWKLPREQRRLTQPPG